MRDYTILDSVKKILSSLHGGAAVPLVFAYALSRLSLRQKSAFS